MDASSFPTQRALPVIGWLLNRVLELDDEAGAQLARLEGRVVEFRIRSPDLQFQAGIEEGQLRLAANPRRNADTIIEASALALLRSGPGAGAQAAMQRGDLRVTGDLQLAAALRTLLADLVIDWEEPLSHVVGDVIAHRIGYAARTLGQWSRHSVEAAKDDVGDYLRDESRLLADPVQADQYLDEVDRLRNDVERLQKRIDRLLDGSGRLPRRGLRA